MKKYIAMAAMAALCAPLALADKAQPENPDSTGFTFTDIKVVKTTPVRDQNKSGTCWCFATTSFLEDELLRKTGKEYDLSEMFTVYHCYKDKARKYQRMGGTINFAQGGSIRRCARERIRRPRIRRSQARPLRDGRHTDRIYAGHNQARP